MWLRLAIVWLLCISGAPAPPGDKGKLRPLAGAKCVCDFKQMSAELNDLSKPDNNHAEQVFSFVHTIISLNFKLNVYFTEFRQCVRYWLNSVNQCEASCSCAKDTVCCRDTALATLDQAVATLKKQVKQTFTAYSHIPFLNEYQQATFDVVNVYSGAFGEFLDALKMDKSKADKEVSHFQAFYKHMAYKNPLDSLFGITMSAKNSTKTIISRLSDHYSCDTTKVLPFYLNVYGTVMQFFLLRELQAELETPRGLNSVSRFTSETEWKQFLKLTDNMTKQIIFCSSTEIYAIRSQEIKEKDKAMRNAAIVFSCFLLLLVIIIATIVFFSCKARQENPVNVREEAVGEVFQHQGHSLLKRYYETDESI